MDSRFEGLQRIDGRWVSALMVLAYFGGLWAAVAVFHGDLPLVWKCLGVPALPRQFEDFRAIALGAERFMASDHRWSAESIAYSTSAYNYTKWWLCAGYLGLNLKTCVAFSIGIICLFFAGALYVLGRLTLSQGVMAGLGLNSSNVK